MANLGICRRCKHCQKLVMSLVDPQDRQLASSMVWCDLSGAVPILLQWASDAPDECPYRLEHLVTNDSFADLIDEEVEGEDNEA